MSVTSNYDSTMMFNQFFFLQMECEISLNGWCKTSYLVSDRHRWTSGTVLDLRFLGLGRSGRDCYWNTNRLTSCTSGWSWFVPVSCVRLSSSDSVRNQLPRTSVDTCCMSRVLVCAQKLKVAFNSRTWTRWHLSGLRWFVSHFRSVWKSNLKNCSNHQNQNSKRVLE